MKTDFVRLPKSFFTQVMPKVQELAELKIVLCAFYLIQQKQDHPLFVTYEELLSCELTDGMDKEIIRRSLDLAVDHKTLLRSTLNTGGNREEVYLINTESSSNQPESIKQGELSLEEGISKKGETEHNIFALYEQNIGLMTPMIAEELKEAEKFYPSQWIEDAFREAVTMNKRSWKYIARILERWASEGKNSGKHKRDIEKDDPDKYIKGKYGHLVKR